jgi:hypothetical protein
MFMNIQESDTGSGELLVLFYLRKYSEKTVQNEFKNDSKPLQLQTVLESDNEPPNIKMNEKPCDFSIKRRYILTLISL